MEGNSLGCDKQPRSVLGANAILLSSYARAGMVLGTLGHPSPEQAAGRTVDFRSDQLAFETIVYEMVAE